MPPGAETTLTYNLGVDLIPSILGHYQYRFESAKVTQELMRERTVIDIFAVTKDKTEKKDTFLKDSERARTWKETDYYKPEDVTISVAVNGTIAATGRASPTPSAPSATPSPAKPDIILRLSNIREDHSGMFSISIRVQADAELVNQGGGAAHNVKALVRARAKSNGRTLPLNGQDTATIPVGDISSGQTVRKALSFDMRMGSGDALDLQKNGLTLDIIVLSDENQKTFNYSYPN